MKSREVEGTSPVSYTHLDVYKRQELYQVFLKSMLSSLDDKFWNSRSKSGHELDLGEEDFKEAAALMLNRLIGIEE